MKNFEVVFISFQRKRGVGGGDSLVYPTEVLDLIRANYPDGVKNYRPRSGKVSRFPITGFKVLIVPHNQKYVLGHLNNVKWLSLGQPTCTLYG